VWETTQVKRFLKIDSRKIFMWVQSWKSDRYFLLTEQMVKLMEPAIRKRYPCNCLPDCDQVSYILESHTKTQSNMWVWC